jgi:hypothetical protein
MSRGILRNGLDYEDFIYSCLIIGAGGGGGVERGMDL